MDNDTNFVPVFAGQMPAQVRTSVDVLHVSKHHVARLMNIKIDRSTLVAFLAGILVTIAVGAASSSVQVGRYQVAGTGQQGLVIDTVTGQVWQHYFAPNQGGSDADFSKPKLGQ
jgi:hypothetical protein